MKLLEMKINNPLIYIVPFRASSYNAADDNDLDDVEVDIRNERQQLVNDMNFTFRELTTGQKAYSPQLYNKRQVFSSIPFKNASAAVSIGAATYDESMDYQTHALNIMGDIFVVSRKMLLANSPVFQQIHGDLGRRLVTDVWMEAWAMSTH